MISFNCLMESFLGMVFVIIEHCLLLKFVLEKRLRERIFWKRRENSFLMVYRFADDLIRCVHNEDASPLRSYSDSSSLSSKCMPMWTSVVAMFRSFKNTQDKEPSSNTDEVIKIIVASNLHHKNSSEASCSHRWP